MTALAGAAILFGLLYSLFLLWYGGRGKPLTPDEIQGFRQELAAAVRHPERQALLADIDTLLASDDGHEFVMQNLARYRPRALYPPGYDFNEDPRAADQRYGRAIVPQLLRYGSLPIFIARRSGTFIEPEGSDAWHYVAMVRYRSRRDFLRFALAVERNDAAVHKWAALEKTHVFPVRPLISLVFVRGAVGLLLALVAAVLYLLIR